MTLQCWVLSSRIISRWPCYLKFRLDVLSPSRRWVHINACKFDYEETLALAFYSIWCNNRMTGIIKACLLQYILTNFHSVLTSSVSPSQHFFHLTLFKKHFPLEEHVKIPYFGSLLPGMWKEYWQFNLCFCYRHVKEIGMHNLLIIFNIF